VRTAVQEDNFRIVASSQTEATDTRMQTDLHRMSLASFVVQQLAEIPDGAHGPISQGVRFVTRLSGHPTWSNYLLQSTCDLQLQMGVE
jgi:hypothetical protein